MTGEPNARQPRTLEDVTADLEQQRRGRIELAAEIEIRRLTKKPTEVSGGGKGWTDWTRGPSAPKYS